MDWIAPRKICDWYAEERQPSASTAAVKGSSPQPSFGGRYANKINSTSAGTPRKTPSQARAAQRSGLGP